MKNVSEIKTACDPDLMVNMVVNDTGHTARAKVKAKKARAERINRVHRRVIWMHTCLFLSGLFFGVAISAAVWSAIL